MATANYKDPVKLDRGLPTDPGLFQATLDNGFRYWIRSTNASGSNHTIHLRLIVFVGSIDESDNERGYTHLLEHVLYRAVEKDAGLNKLISEAGLSWGADVNAFTYHDRTEYRFAFSGEQVDIVPRALKFSALLLDRVKILDKHLLAEKPIVEAEWRTRESNNSDSPGAFSRAFYGDTLWLRRPPIGNLRDLRAATRASLQRYWDMHYQPRNAMLIVTGKIDPFELRTQIEDQFASLENRSAAIEHFEGSKQYRSRPPIEVVSFKDGSVDEPYVRGHVFLPSNRIDNYRSFRTSVIDQLAIEVISQAQGAQFSGHPLCVGYNAATSIAARRPKVFEFELIPVDQAGFADCAELLQGAFAGLSGQLDDRKTLKRLRSRAEHSIRSSYTGLGSQSPVQMVETLSQMALRGNKPMSPAFIAREFDTIVKTVSNEDIRGRVSEILSRPVLYAFGAPLHAANSLPDSAAVATRLQNVRSATWQRPVTAAKFTASTVSTDARIESQKTDDDWTQWTLSNGVNVWHIPSREHEGLVAIRFVDSGGFAGTAADVVNETRYLTRYHVDVAMGQLTADERQGRSSDKKMFIETTMSAHTHGVAGVVVRDNVDELFTAFAAIFQPLKNTAEGSGFVARSQHWRRARKAKGSDVVWQQYWRRMVEGAPASLTGDHSTPLALEGFVKAHKLLYQTAIEPVVVVYGDISAASVKARLIDTFGAIKKKQISDTSLVYRKISNTDSNLTVDGRAQAGALRDTVDVHLFQHCANSGVDYAQFVNATSILSRLIAGGVSSRIREQLGLAYAPGVAIDYSGNSSQVARYHIRVTTGLSDAASVRNELLRLLGQIGNGGFNRQHLNGVLTAIRSKRQLDARYPERRASQIANGLFVGLTPSQALRAPDTRAENAALKQVNRIARECFGTKTVRPLIVTHRGAGT